MSRRKSAATLEPTEAALTEPGVPALPAAAAAGSAAAPASEPHPLDHDGDGRPGGSVALEHALVFLEDHDGHRQHDVVWASAARAAQLRAAGVVRDASAAEVELAQPRVTRI